MRPSGQNVVRVGRVILTTDVVESAVLFRINGCSQH
jgi:hypothetical protein